MPNKPRDTIPDVIASNLAAHKIAQRVEDADAVIPPLDACLPEDEGNP
jgi:hypothetical protein